MGRVIDWYYRRNGCTSCRRADEFMATAGMSARETVDARKEKLGKRETVAILRKTSRVVAVKGKQVVDYDLKRDPPAEKLLLESIMGPTGHLRAPAARLGKLLVVGYDERAWGTLLDAGR